MQSCYNCKHLLNCGACKTCGTNFSSYESMTVNLNEAGKIEDLELNSKSPQCPVCGQEMEQIEERFEGKENIFYLCYQNEDGHVFNGANDDPTGEKTRAMIADMRGETRVAELERELDGAKATLSHPGTNNLKENATLGEIAHYYHVQWLEQIHNSQNRVIEAEAKADSLERKISELESIIKVQDACLDELDAARDRMKLMPEIDAIYPGHAGTIQLLEDLNEGLERDLASAINRCRELTQLLNAERLQSGDELRVKIAELESELEGKKAIYKALVLHVKDVGECEAEDLKSIIRMQNVQLGEFDDKPTPKATSDFNNIAWRMCTYGNISFSDCAHFQEHLKKIRDEFGIPKNSEKKGGV